MTPESKNDGAKAEGNLYAKLGGEAAVNAAVAIFYAKILADPQLARFFEGIDMKKMERKQVAFMTYVFGGAANYDGRDLSKSHARLIRDHGMTVHHFDLVAGHLDSSLRELKVPEDLLAEAMAVVATAKPAIFGPDVK